MNKAQEYADRFNKFVVVHPNGEIADVNKYGYAMGWSFKTEKAAQRHADRIGGNVVVPRAALVARGTPLRKFTMTNNKPKVAKQYQIKQGVLNSKNWYGYFGDLRVKNFGANEREAREWLQKMNDKSQSIG